ncbi:unnamed protein product [Adineta ricciae]|uniref:Uncharacterized protein n=1 Tax=Adineta ricciae TaxID=249248 RepID=A0A815JT01_ADIRI|nr:unnamed protein product [Adineta ricciae]CAF1383944.1 unnamed protein product [Adineta ricciae]
MNGWPTNELGRNPTNWTGIWYGIIETFPKNELGSGWNVKLEIGNYPMKDFTCTIWKSIFTENDSIKTIKDYQLCRGNHLNDLYIDEGNNVTIKIQWINKMFISSFKYKGVLAISTMKMFENILEEDILIIDDYPADENHVTSLRIQSIHRMKMKRMFN